jgi:HPt (histidine-containing phosphotransfer) domain-containing protein
MKHHHRVIPDIRVGCPKDREAGFWPGLNSVARDIQPQRVTVLTPATPRHCAKFYPKFRIRQCEPDQAMIEANDLRRGMNPERLTFDQTPDDHVATGVISVDVLEGLRKLQQPGEPDFVTELIDLFLHDTASHLAAMRAAVSDDNISEVRRLAHLMKGSSGNIGAPRMAELYEELETTDLGTTAGANDGQALLLRIEDEFRQVGDAFNAQRKQ